MKVQRTDGLLFSGIIIGYVTFFVYPVFLNPERTMKFIPYIVKIDPIGLDLAQMLDYCREWFFRQHSPYVGANLYPPLAVVLFIPLLFVDAVTAFHVITLLNLVCYTFCVLALPWLLNPRTARIPLLLIVFVTGLHSYGFHFELERGQFNVIAMTCCLLALYLFHKCQRARYAAYLLFCLAVQLKMYPAIFVLLFVRDWSDWRGTLRRIAGLLAVNIGLLFALGMGICNDFFQALIRESGSNLWIGNHSIRAFVLLSPLPYKTLCQLILLGIVAGCLGVCLIVSIKSNSHTYFSFNAPLFLTCTLAALLIPSVSNDYKLTLLTVAVSIAFPHQIVFTSTSRPQKLLYNGILLVIAFGYATTLYSFTHKPLPFKNNLPALMIMLVSWTAFVVFSLKPGPSALQNG